MIKTCIVCRLYVEISENEFEPNARRDETKVEYK